MKNRHVKVAICGKLPTTYNFLLKQGVVQIDQYEEATEIIEESVYHLILIYAPCGEGILDTVYERRSMSGRGNVTVPIRLLNEPACHSALLELKTTVQQIASTIQANGCDAEGM